MTIPKVLKIGGHLVTIDDSQELSGLDGEACTHENTIKISKILPQSQKEATLIHEIFHFINSTLGETPMGHSLLESLAQQFYQVLADNNLLKQENPGLIGIGNTTSTQYAEVKAL